jgi:Pyridoxamine 5'-phosphate oxidase
MSSWSVFAAAAPRLARDIEALLCQYGQGLGYLATVRRDGGPRVHPVSPVIGEGGLFCFVMSSPKRRDLERDGRYALHTYPAEQSDDEAYVLGRVHRVMDTTRRERLATAVRAAPDVNWRLYELDVEVAVVTHRPQWGVAPVHRLWRAGDEGADGPAPGSGAVARWA